MKKEITVGQLVSAAVTVLIAMFAGWMSINNKVATLEEKNRTFEHQLYNLQLSMDKKYDRIDDKLDKITNAVYEKK
jgi:hypothetical protein